MKVRWFLVAIWSAVLIGCSLVNAEDSHKLVKRQSPARPGGGGLPLSRRRQFPAPEELEESEYQDSEEELKNPAPAFRGRQPPPEDDYPEDQSYTEAPQVTTPTPTKAPPRIQAFNNRFAARPRLGSQTTAKTTAAPKPPSSGVRSRAIPPSRTINANIEKKPEPAPEVSTRRSSSGSQRVRPRGRLRTRTSSTSTTTTTTTTLAPPPEEYYYYYEDEEETPKNPPIATTTSTTTTTTTPRPRPSISRPRPVSTRIRSTSRPPVKFDPESQFAPPPEAPQEIKEEPRTTKKFTTTSTMKPEETGGIPAHLRHKYRPRADGRFIDFLRDPNRPRELKGFDLTDYPFYIVVPDDIDFDCDDRKDGYYASIPHKCQLFHYCFAGARYDFLCANYTLYDQTTFTCRFAINVDCESSAKYYFRNDDLWKETTTTPAPTSPPKRRKIRPRDEDYEDDDYEEDYDYEEEERRRRPPKRRRNRRKNRRKPAEDDEEKKKK
ncbi:chitin-binding type-2 domain-containing protein [Caerostris extrusa]|uniref:Chitin-binding type-2 domain-containing protein n=1 Tax=Caerostris extrusa TaxID=172846 RepID=A0AAV4RAH7_CAEEX|nr:chitin-binding type-2 domain-containing protein [Caerostris extrusa]